MSDFIEENKKFIIIISVIVGLFVIAGAGLTIYNFVSSDTSDSAIEQPKFVKSDFTIPVSVKNLETTDTPILYDYVNGTFGLNEEGVSMTPSKDIYIFLTKKDSSKVYFSYIKAKEGDINVQYYLPSFSTSPLGFYLDSEEDMESFFKSLNKMDGEEGFLKLEEKEYTFYVVPSLEVKSVDVSWLIQNSTPGSTFTQILDGGLGYPTNIIRQKCDLEAIKSNCNIDFSNSFWDNNNYESHIKCVLKDSSLKNKTNEKYVVLTPAYKKIVSDGDPVYTYDINGYSYNMSLESVEKYLKDNGYISIDEAKSQQSYASYSEFQAVKSNKSIKN